jgi:hypothetical protein
MPVSDSGDAFESIELFTTDGVQLRSRPIDWRSAGGENGTVWRTLDADDTINHDLYHSVEYHGGYAYFVRSDHRTVRRAPQTGTVKTVFTNDEPMLDWRVSLGGKYVAVYREDGTHIDIWSTDPRKLVETIEARTGAVGEPGNPSFDHFGIWDYADGVSTFTASVVTASPQDYVLSFLQVNIDEAGAAAPVALSASPAGIPIRSFNTYAFDPEQKIVAWDTYPMVQDPGAAERFVRTQSPIALYLYSFTEKHAYQLDVRPVCHFLPKWIRPGVLEFNTASMASADNLKETYIVRDDILSLIVKATPTQEEERLFVKEFISALVAERYSEAATYFAYPVREGDLRKWRTTIAAACEANSLSHFAILQPRVCQIWNSSLEVYTDNDGFCISDKEAEDAIAPLAQKSSEYAAIMKQYGAAMRRLEEVDDPFQLDEKTRLSAWNGYAAVRALYRKMAPKLTISLVNNSKVVYPIDFPCKETQSEAHHSAAMVVVTSSGLRLESFDPTYIER